MGMWNGMMRTRNMTRGRIVVLLWRILTIMGMRMLLLHLNRRKLKLWTLWTLCSLWRLVGLLIMRKLSWCTRWCRKLPWSEGRLMSVTRELGSEGITPVILIYYGSVIVMVRSLVKQKRLLNLRTWKCSLYKKSRVTLCRVRCYMRTVRCLWTPWWLMMGRRIAITLRIICPDRTGRSLNIRICTVPVRQLRNRSWVFMTLPALVQC